MKNSHTTYGSVVYQRDELYYVCTQFSQSIIFRGQSQSCNIFTLVKPTLILKSLELSILHGKGSLLPSISRNLPFLGSSFSLSFSAIRNTTLFSTSPVEPSPLSNVPEAQQPLFWPSYFLYHEKNSNPFYPKV